MEQHKKRWLDEDIKYIFTEIKNNSINDNNINKIALYLKRTPNAVNLKIKQYLHILINVMNLDINTVANLINIPLNDILNYLNNTLVNEVNDTKNNKIFKNENDSTSDNKNYTEKEIILNKKQQKSLDEFKSGRNIFITGPAGTGKSITLHQIIKYCKNNNINVGVTATTGSAALLIGGKTINSFLGIKLAEKSADQLYSDLIKMKPLMTKIRELKVLIIDEISMMNDELFDKISCFLCLCRKSTEQFGGLQVVLTGDFCQLESVNGDYCFNSYSWKRLKLKVIFLNKMIRQNQDKLFQRILEDLRYGICSDETYELLCKCKNTEFNDIKPTILYSTNEDVKKINDLELQKLITSGSKTCEYSIILPDEKKHHDKINNWINSLDINKNIKLCVGAQVVITFNINQDHGLVNGTRGKIIELFPNKVIIKCIDQSIHTIEYTKLTYLDDSSMFFRFMPLKLAYALTIHKCQGMTLDAIEIDIGNKIFASGQAYTALSRARTLDSIKMIDISKKSFYVKESVINFYRQYDNTLI